MSRGTRGGSRGRRGNRFSGKHTIAGQEVDWDAPDDTPSEPQKWFPDMGQDFPRPQPPSLREKRALQAFKATRERIHKGPLSSVLSDKARIEKARRTCNTFKFNPFSDLPMYSDIYKKPQRDLPRFDTRTYPIHFFPEELINIFGTSKHSSSKRKRHTSRQKPALPLEGDEEAEADEEMQDAEKEEEDDDAARKPDEDEEPDEAEPNPDETFEDDEEEMAGDYNAEGYFSAGEGDDDDVMGGGGDDGGAEFD